MGFVVVVAVLFNFMYVRVHGKSINVFDLFSASMGQGGGPSSSSVWPDSEAGGPSSGSGFQQQSPQRPGRGKAFKSIAPSYGEEFKELEF